ncbi:ankyrin repeat domain-containing protein [Candidatus Lariskella endosymbiont of Epinotia ramella]|uniref:ankyrin repeat domain-containing protein n=1 Tax=Candidatus Lariskella endosymbiont of Epinotia ramella TaxID=3066224 RepID=UPI0030CF5A80
MKHTEETIDLRENYDEIISQMQNDNYLLPPELLNDEQFFFHILKQENSSILITFFAAAQNNGVRMEQIIEGQKYEVLKLAAENQDNTVIGILLDFANIKEALKGNGDYLAFSEAAKNQDHKVMELLLSHADKHNINIKEALKGSGDYRAFSKAAENQNHQVMELLLSHADKNSIDIKEALKGSGDYYAFEYAARNQNHKVMELLLSHADKNSIDIKEALKGNYDSYLAFNYAAKNQNHKVMELLLSHADKNNIDIKEALKYWDYFTFRHAAQNVNHEVMRLLFERAQTLGMNIKTILANKDYELFHYAAQNTNPNVIKLLFEHAKTLEIDVRKTVLKNPSFQALENIKSAALDALLQVLVTTKDAEIENVISQNPAIFTAPRDAEYQKIKALMNDTPFLFKEPEKLILALQHIEWKDEELEDKELFAKRYKEILKRDVGYQEIKALMYTIPSFFYDKERLILALSHINPKDKKLFAARCEEILAHYSFRNKLEEIVAYKSKNTTAKNLITDSAYKISVLRQEVGDSLFSNKGNVDNKWLKSGELTKLSLVKKDLMEYVQPKENNSNSLNGETKKTDWNNLKTNLKTTVLSFLIAPKEAKPESISISAILEALRQPLHNALETQEIKAGTYNKLLALLRKEVTQKGMLTNTSNNLSSKEVAMPKVYEEQSEIYNEPLASLRKALYAKDDTDTNNLISLNVPALEVPYEQSEQLKELISLRKAKYEKAGATPDKEPPPPAPELNKYLINKELGVMEVSGLKPKIVALSDASQEQNVYAINSKAEFAKQNTAYVPSSLPKTLYNVAVGFKVLDTAIDTTRLLYEPTANNATKVIVDSAHIYSMLAGFNLYSAVINAAEIIYLGSIGEYGKVLQNAVITTAYMGLSYVANKSFLYAAASVGVPQLALAYSAVTAGCSAYNALSNLYSFHEEYSSGDLALKSDAAYADLNWFLHNALDWSGNDLDVELAAYAENDWQNDLYQSDNDLHVEL